MLYRTKVKTYRIALYRSIRPLNLSVLHTVCVCVKVCVWGVCVCEGVCVGACVCEGVCVGACV